jgi:hypothetical protein
MLHRTYFMNAIKMHVGDLDDRWTQLEQETLKIAYDIMGAPPPLPPAPPPPEPPPPPPPREITATDINDALAGKMIGVSGKLAARLVIDRLLRRLMIRP